MYCMPMTPRIHGTDHALDDSATPDLGPNIMAMAGGDDSPGVPMLKLSKGQGQLFVRWANVTTAILMDRAGNRHIHSLA